MNRKAGSVTKTSFPPALELATRPGWMNFLFLLFLWYLGIALYIGAVSSQSGLDFSLIQYYSLYSWPSFVLCYTLAIWIIPYAFKKQNVTLLILLTVLMLLVYVLLRFLNNSAIDPKYYVTMYSNGTRVKEKWYTIVSQELIRGIQFTSLAYAYRLPLNRLIDINNRKDLEKNNLKAELASLRFQLNPHFLFNALNSIYNMSIKKSDKTPAAILMLSDMFRHVLQQNEEMVSIDEEIEHLNRLVDFEKMRFPDSVIRFNKSIEPGQHNLLIPPLLLSTFLENAFKHGDPGTEEHPVVIDLKVANNKLLYSVVNPISTSLTGLKDSSGFGLSNQARRLDIMFPDRHTIETSAKDNVYSAKLILVL